MKAVTVYRVVISVTVGSKVYDLEFTDPKKLEALFKEPGTLGEAVREAIRRESSK